MIKEVRALVKPLIEELLLKKFEEPEFEDCFLIDIVSKGRKIEVYIDRDSGVGFATCRQVSRYLESHLDEKSDLPDDYILEVSSPGIDRPLVARRQYPRNIGRKMKVVLKDGSRVSGKLEAVNDDGIELKKKMSKSKKSTPGTIEIPFGDIAEAKIIVSFK